MKACYFWAMEVPLLGSITAIGMLDEFFVGPTSPTAAPPYRSPNEPTGDRSPRDDDSPKMPGIDPRWS